MANHPLQIDDIFDEALRRAPGKEREQYLSEVCGDDAALKQRVARLLRAVAEAGSFLESPARDTSPTTDQPIAERPGTQIGPYKLLQQIGEGGMGVVYMAEQLEPVNRRVALKVIKPGMDTRQVIARFEAERQALSLMDHPNIAKVLDAGTTESGRPYFVMELVKGQPITQYCDEKHLTPRQRLELFIPVCQAIQHAHQKGIIHRDIKPTNILVAEYDQRAAPKVIDFGVAKATSQSLTAKTMFTGLGQIVGTLEYMSPEQAKVNQLDIDTRSDIYSLGVLLYELLTGSTPLDKERLRSAAFDEMLRIIRDEEPEKPSTRLSDSSRYCGAPEVGRRAVASDGPRSVPTTLASIAAVRSTEPAKLTKLVRGELDWIVMKALEKDRNRRYETANGLALDIQRYLADEPVQACPPSVRYRASKFVRKYRTPVAATAAFISLLIASALLSTYHAFRITAEQAKTRLQEREANEQRLAAERSQRLAQERLAEGLAATGDALLTSGQILRARDAYQQSMQLCQHLNLSPMVAMTGLAQSYVDSPAALLPFNPRMPWAPVEFSPDGRTIASAGESLTIWDMATGLKVRDIPCHGTRAIDIAFSHDGGRLCSAHHDGFLRIWDVASGTELLRLGGRVRANCAMFSPDDQRLVSGGAGGWVYVWDVVSGRQLNNMKHGGEVWSVAFSPDGSLIASGGGSGVLKVWDSKSGALHASIQTASRGAIECVVFNSEGTEVLMAHRGKFITLFGLDDQKEIRSFGPVEGSTTEVAFLNGNTLFASTGEEGIVRVWELATGERVRQYAAQQSGVRHLALSPDNNYLVTSDLQLWNLSDTADQFGFKAHSSAINRCAVSKNGRLLLTGDREGWIKLWDIATWKLLWRKRTSTLPVESLCLTHLDGDLLTASRTEIQLRDIITGDIRRTFPLKPSQDWSERFVLALPDGRRAAIKSGTNDVQFINLETGEITQTISLKFPRSIAASLDGKHVLTGDEKLAVLWDATSGEIVHTLSRHSWWVTCGAFSRDGRMALTGSWDCRAILWDLQNGQTRHVFTGHTGWIRDVAFSADGTTAFTASEDGTVRIWDAISGKQIRRFEHQSKAIVKSMALLDERGHAIVSGDSEGTLHVWKTDWPVQLRERSERLVEAQKVLRHSPNDAASLQEIGNWYIFRGEWSLALELFERAAAAGARVPSLTLARCYWKVGRASEAEKWFNSATEANEAPPEYLAMCKEAVRMTESELSSP